MAGQCYMHLGGTSIGIRPYQHTRSTLDDRGVGPMVMDDYHLRQLDNIEHIEGVQRDNGELWVFAPQVSLGHRVLGSNSTGRVSSILLTHRASVDIPHSRTTHWGIVVFLLVCL